MLGNLSNLSRSGSPSPRFPDVSKPVVGSSQTQYGGLGLRYDQSRSQNRDLSGSPQTNRYMKLQLKDKAIDEKAAKKSSAAFASMKVDYNLGKKRVDTMSSSPTNFNLTNMRTQSQGNVISPTNNFIGKNKNKVEDYLQTEVVTARKVEPNPHNKSSGAIQRITHEKLNMQHLALSRMNRMNVANSTDFAAKTQSQDIKLPQADSRFKSTEKSRFKLGGAQHFRQATQLINASNKNDDYGARSASVLQKATVQRLDNTL